MTVGKKLFKINSLPPPPAAYRLKIHLNSRHTCRSAFGLERGRQFAMGKTPARCFGYLQERASGVCGRSMIEMLGVLAIIGILSAGGIMGYSTAMENYRVNKTLNDMREMAMKTQTLLTNYGTSSTSNYVDTHKLHQVGIIPDDYYATITGDCGDSSSNAGCYMKSPIADNTQIFYYEYVGSSYYDKLLYFFFYYVPNSACVKMATADWSKFGEGSLVSLRFINIPLTVSKPLTLEEAQSKCSNSNSNSIRFMIYLERKPL